MSETTLTSLNDRLYGDGVQAPAGKVVRPAGASAGTLRLYRREPSVDLKKFDFWYEKAIGTTAKPEGKVTGPVTDFLAGGAMNVVNFAQEMTAASLVFGGDVLQGGAKGLADLLMKIPSPVPIFVNVLRGGEPFTESARKTREAFEAAGEGREIDLTRFHAEAGDSWRTSLAKQSSLMGFAIHMRGKKFREALDPEIESRIAYDVGGGLASFSRTMLLGLVNPGLAIGAMTGEISSQKFLEARAGGVGFVPSAVFAATIGYGQGQLERITLSLLRQKFLGPLGMGITAMVENFIEEGLQAGLEVTVEKAVGFRDTEFVEDVSDVLYEAFLGGVVGFTGGSTVATFARNRIRSRLETELKDVIKNPQQRHFAAGALANRILAGGIDLQQNMVRDLLQITGKDMDTMEGMVTGKTDPGSALKTLSDSFNEKAGVPDDGVDVSEAVGQGVAEDVSVSAQAISEAQVVDEKTKDLLRQEKVIRTGRQRQLMQERDTLDAEVEALQTKIALAKEQGKAVARLTDQLSRKLTQRDAVDFQLFDLEDTVIEQLQKENVSVPADQIERVRQLARRDSEIAERKRLRKEIRQERKSAEALRSGLVAYARKYLPRGEREVILSDLVKTRELKGAALIKVLDKIEARRDAVLTKQFKDRIGRVIGQLEAKIGSQGQAMGRFGSAALQSVANQIVDITTWTKERAALEHARINEAILQSLREEQNEDRPNDAEELRFANELIDKLYDLENRSVEELAAAHEFLSRAARTLKTVGRFIRGVQQDRHEFHVAQTAEEILKPGHTVESLAKLSRIERVKREIGAFMGGAVYNFGTAMELLIQKKDKSQSFIKNQIVERMFRARRHEANLHVFFIERIQDMYRKAFGFETMKQMDEQMARDSSAEAKDGAYVLPGAVLHDGTTVDLTLPRSFMRYWYMIAHQADGSLNPDVYEVLTGENQLAALEKKATDNEIDPDSAEFREMVQKEIKGNKLPAEIVDDIFAQIENSPKDLAFIAEQRKLYNDTYRMLNPTHRLLFGVNLPKIQDYAPWARDAGQPGGFSLVEDMAGRFKYLPGFVKVRKPGSMAPFMQIGDVDILNGTAVEISHFVSFYPVVKDVGSILSSKAVRDAINVMTDGKFLKTRGITIDGDYYRNMLKSLELIGTRGKRNLHIFHGVTRALNNNISKAALGLKGTIGLLQVSSSVLALDFVSVNDFMDGLNDFAANPKEAIRVMGMSPIMKTRYRNIMIEMQDLVRSENFKLFSTKKRWDEFLFAFVRAGNRAGIALGGWTVFRAEFNKTGDVNKAFEAFDRFVETTQQSAAFTELSPGQASAWRILFKFISQPLQIFRREMLAVDDFRKGRIGAPELMKKLIVFHIIIPMILEMIRNVFKPSKETLLTAAVVGPMTGIPVFGDYLEGIMQVSQGQKPFDFAPPVFKAPFESLYDIYKIVDGHQRDISGEELFKWYAELGQDAGTIAGIPTIFPEALQTGADIHAGELPPEALFLSGAGFSNYVINQWFNPGEKRGRRSSGVGSLIRR